jgi:hypothetical protein
MNRKPRQRYLPDMPRFFSIQKKIRKTFCKDKEPEFSETDGDPEFFYEVTENFIRVCDPAPENPDEVPEIFIRNSDPVPENPGKIRNVIETISDLPQQLSARLKNRIGSFEHTIARFPQRRFA